MYIHDYNINQSSDQTDLALGLVDASRTIITVDRTNERAALAAKLSLQDISLDNLTYTSEDSYFVVMLASPGEPLKQLWLDEKPFLTISTGPKFDPDGCLPDDARQIGDDAWDSDYLPVLDADRFAKLCSALIPFGLVDDHSPVFYRTHTPDNEPKQLMLEAQAKYGHVVLPMRSGKNLFSSATTRLWDSTANQDELIDVLAGKTGITGYSIVVAHKYCVIDIDTTTGHASDGLAPWLDKFSGEQHPFKTMPITQSPSGGLHLFYRHVRGIKSSASAIGAGIDVKAGNSIVLAPLSYRPDMDSRYRHLPCHTFDLPPAEWDGHEHILFDVMFHGLKHKLASVEILSHEDLTEIAHDDWFDYARDKIHEAGADARTEIDKRRAKLRDNMTNAEAASLNNLGSVTLSNIINGLRNSDDVSTGNRNATLYSKAFLMGNLIQDAETGATLDQDTCIEQLIRATNHWTTHPEAGRRATINSGIQAGIAKAQVEVIEWLQSTKDRCLGIIDRETTVPAGNIRDVIPVEEARALTMSTVKAAIAQRKALFEATGGLTSIEAAKQRKELRDIRETSIKTRLELEAEADAPVPNDVKYPSNRAKDIESIDESIAAISDEISTLDDVMRKLDVYQQITVDAGTGKSHAIVSSLVDELPYLLSLGDQGQIIYAVPTLKLAEELAERFEKAGATVGSVAVYRGRNAADPTAERENPRQACLIPYASDQIASSGGSVAKSMCSTCPLAGQCFYMSQQTFEPTIWICAHHLLTSESDILPESPYMTFIDEEAQGVFFKPAKRGISRRKITRPNAGEIEIIDNDPDRLLESQIDMVEPDIMPAGDDEDSITQALEYTNQLGQARDMMRRVVAALKRGNEYQEIIRVDEDGFNVRDIIEQARGGYLGRSELAKAGITLDLAQDALRLERLAVRSAKKVAKDDEFEPQKGLINNRYLDEIIVADYNRHSHIWLKLWQVVIDLLTSDEEILVPCFDNQGRFGGKDLLWHGDGGDFIESIGRIYVDDAGNLFMSVKGSIADRYSGFVVAVDATPESIIPNQLTGDIDKPFATYAFDHHDPIAVATPNQYVVAVLGAGAIISKKAIARKAGDPKRGIEPDDDAGATDCVRSLCLAITADVLKNKIDPSRVLVITHKQAVKGLCAALPKSISSFLHYGNLRGVDTFGDFDACYLVGEHLLPASACEAWCESMYNQPIGGISKKLPKILQTRDGKSHAVDVWSHTDELVAKRIDDTRNGEMLQAIGRLRGVNRTADNPCRIVVLADEVLPIEYDEVIEWPHFNTTAIDVAELYGVVPTSARTGSRLFPWISTSDDWWSERLERNNLFSCKSLDSLYSNSYKGIQTLAAEKIAGIRVAGSKKSIPVKYNAEIVGEKLSIYLKDVLDIKCEVIGDRGSKFVEMIETYGFIPKSKNHCHKLAFEIFPKVNSAQRGLAAIEPEDGEIAIKYRLNGRGQSDTFAIVRAANELAARDIILRAFPDASIVSDQ